MGRVCGLTVVLLSSSYINKENGTSGKVNYFDLIR